MCHSWLTCILLRFLGFFFTKTKKKSDSCICYGKIADYWGVVSEVNVIAIAPSAIPTLS